MRTADATAMQHSMDFSITRFGNFRVQEVAMDFLPDFD